MTDEHCTNLKELLDAERPMLNIAFGHRRYLISKAEHKSPEDIDWARAKQEFIDHFGNAWMEGFKLAYCNFGCKDRDKCKLKNGYNREWEKYGK